MIIYREETLVIPKDGHTTHDEIWKYLLLEIDIELKSLTDLEKEYVATIQRKLTP